MQPQPRVVCQRRPAKASEDAGIPRWMVKDEHRVTRLLRAAEVHGVSSTSEQLNRIDAASGYCLTPSPPTRAPGDCVILYLARATAWSEGEGLKTLPLFHFNRQSPPWKQFPFALPQIAV